ncbi:hypothetical protein EXS70_03135 [Candidatus Peribacteria bacterium]|nr:hypothetical protein [Candidatus Peribacteria bacterium]
MTNPNITEGGFETFPILEGQLPPRVTMTIARGEKGTVLELQRVFDAEGQTTNLAIAQVGQGGFALNPKTGEVGSPVHGLKMTVDQMKRLLPPTLIEEFKLRGFINEA